MTAFQIVSLCALACVIGFQYLPTLPVFFPKQNTLKDIASVIAIRDGSTNPEVVKACQALLQALLQ